ncbi:MAG: Uma2 family endonuclease [Actinomycetota bacterium]|nr:Uma2 family endonuclease [Actinomycetota bacterium]
MALQPAPAPYRFTVEEYYRLAEVGFFHEDSRVELLEGEIVQMAPIANQHAQCVRRLTTFFSDQLRSRVVVSVQNPVRLSDDSEPEPDVVLLNFRPEDYAAHPSPADVVLLVEVSDTTVAWDRSRKVPLYARAAIQEVWLVDLVAGAVEVYRQPDGETFGDVRVVGPEGRVAPATFPGAEISVGDLLH